MLNQSKEITLKINIYGLVQGVGFRPFTKGLAKKMTIRGTVKNYGGAVEIIAQATQDKIDAFISTLEKNPPPGGEIIHMETEVLADAPHFPDFSIVPSKSQATLLPVIPRDIATCENCRKELFDVGNRRYRHPFISCAACGPRYSIISNQVYDRENTAMARFPLCNDCSTEYNDINDPRCYAQTVACPNCGPKLSFYPAENSSSPIDEAVRHLKEGKIIAVKDIGGYHFACSALDKLAVENLRRLKQRKTKPLAVMFRNVTEIRCYATVSKAEEELLTSAAAPIVLLKADGKKKLPKNTAGETEEIGAFLPSNPLQILLLEEISPLIMTSGNFSGSPIIINDEEMETLYRENHLLSGVLTHNREILTPLDDSVTRIINGKIQMIRRARGYAPLPIYMEKSTEKPLLAYGGDLKATCGYLIGHYAYLSQYCGDLAEEKTFSNWQNTISHLGQLLNITAAYSVADLHPLYFSTYTAEKAGLPLTKIQHHKSHFAGVIAEHCLKGPVLGFVFDGTGYGDDGAIWGGEVFRFENDAFDRICHLEYIPIVGGDEGAKNSELLSYSYLAYSGETCETNEFALVKKALEHKINVGKTSSMGRLFDCISALLNIKKYNTFEGECAIALENTARHGLANKVEPAPLYIPFNNGKWQITALIRAIAKGDYSKEAYALGFHYAIRDAVINLAQREKIKKIALSGGVFQNRLLTEMLLKDLTKLGFCVYINEKVPCGDGGIALGQLYLAAK